ncbi:hypothetical protein B0T10DRAFT_54808 [Thelonectria olida]|uniref:DUF7580 domain-containing protein n=1 Tax=Thelonectria olida TaxID=1576542 RepID=A0A9P8W3T5_9HYPO|nr:hypothetical protein B0T10DRAFT_54808 [Thelonectria olida]
MASPHSGLEMSDLGDIYHATMGCISRFEACLLVKPLMNGGWAESRLADMRLWASGVGALASPQASLDRRLQYQPKARLVLTNLLLTLDEFIKSCHLLALGESHHNRLDDEAESKYAPVSSKEGALESAHGNDSVHAPSSLSWFATLGSDQKTASGASTDSEAGDDAEEGSETTLEDAIKDIEDILDQLIILGFAIRKSGTVARLQRADRSFKPNENSDLQRHLEFILRNDTAKRRKRGEENGEITTNDRMQWSEVDFGEAVTRQQKHLIQANLRRRHRFGYARRHQQKLDQPVTQPLVTRPGPISPVGDHRPPALDADPQSLPTEDSPSKNLPTDPPENLQAPETRATTPSTAKGDILKMAIPSQAAASRVSVSVANIHYPSPPPISNQVGFRCPCCYQTLPGMFKDWSRWRKHIAEDLCPYTCPFPECPRPEVLYISRAAWRDHVLETHGAGKYWECLACSGTGVPNRFSTAEQFAGHNRAWHKDTISEDQVAGLQTLCQKTEPPNIAHCPLCPWPQDEEAVPDAAANLEHVGNCIHEFSLSALPWAESSDAEFATVRAPASTKVQEWFDMTSEEIEDTEETEDDDIQKIDIRTVDIQAIDIKLFGILPMPPRRNKPENPYIPEEYFAESSRESSQVERGSRTVDSDLPEVRGTYSDDTQLDPLVPSSIETGSVVEPEMLEFAIETTKMLRGAALRLMSEGSERGERRYTSSLATQLHIISEYLETTNFAGIPHARARIANLLCTYERLCTMPRRLPETVPRSSSSQFDRKSYPTIDLLLKHKTPQSIFEKTLKNLTTRHGSANGAEIFRLLRKFPPTDGKSDIQTLEKPHRFSTYLVVMHSALFNRHSCSHPAPLYMYIQLNSMQLRRESFEEAVTIDAVFQDHTAPGHSVAASPQSLVDVHIGVRLSSSDNTNTGLETGLPVSSLCDIIIMGRRQKSQLHLEVSNSLLWMEPLTSLKPSALPGRSISLAEVIKGFRLSTRMRVLLSYTLAKATWQFYDTPWMLQGWTKDSIYFLSNRTAGIANEVYINEPFLFTNFETSNRTPDRYRHLSSHRFPKILAFGIMLLEIELGTHLEDHQNHTGTDPIGKPTANADHIAAMEMFHKIEDSFSVVRDVIKHCLDATIFYPFGDDIQGLCDTFYSNIVSKLRALYEVVWGDPDTSDILPIRLNSLVVSHLQATEESSRPSSQ